MNNVVFRKTTENVRKHRNKNLLAKEMKKTEILMNNSACLGLSVLELSKKLMFELYDFLKPNYGEKLKLCYVDT